MVFCCRRNLTAPRAALGEDWDKCSTYKANWSHVLLTLTPPDPSTPTVPCEHGWEFELTDIPYHTVVSEVSKIVPTNPATRVWFEINATISMIRYILLNNRRITHLFDYLYHLTRMNVIQITSINQYLSLSMILNNKAMVNFHKRAVCYSGLSRRCHLETVVSCAHKPYHHYKLNFSSVLLCSPSTIILVLS